MAGKSHIIQQDSHGKFTGRGERRGRKADRERGKDRGREGKEERVKKENRDNSLGIREAEDREIGGGQGLPLIRNIANVHSECSSWLQLMTYSVRTLKAGQYRCLNTNTNKHHSSLDKYFYQ